MKLLLDENLSRGLVAALQDLYPGTTHVEYVDLTALLILPFAITQASMVS